jgi:hypothetical protein
MRTYRFARGETITIPLVDDGAEDGEEDTVTCKMKVLPSGKDEIAADTDVSGTCTVSYRAATASLAKGWNVELASSASKLLDVGRYMIDARVTVGGIDRYSDQAVIELYEPATPND